MVALYSSTGPAQESRMTRTKSIGWLVGVAVFIWSAAAGVVLAQSGETSQPTRTSSGYSTKAGSKGTPAAGTKSQPTGGAASGSKGAVYGPAAPRSEQPARAQGGPSPLRRTAGEEPLREPVSGT